MRFPCGKHKTCDNYKNNACDGCKELDKYPKWFIYHIFGIPERVEKLKKSIIYREDEKRMGNNSINE